MAKFEIQKVLADFRDNKLSKEMVKAINTTTLSCKIQGLAKIESREVDVFMVFGVANGVTSGTDERKKAGSGDWSALKGQFWAVKCDEPHKVFESGRLFLPAGQDFLESLIVTGELDAKDRPIYGQAEFSVMIVAEPANNAHGYRWKLRSLIDAGKPPENSVQARLLGQMAAQTAKALSGPETAKSA